MQSLIIKCFNREKYLRFEFDNEINRFTKRYKFCDSDLNTLVSMLRKSAYPCECIGKMDLF